MIRLAALLPAQLTSRDELGPLSEDPHYTLYESRLGRDRLIRLGVARTMRILNAAGAHVFGALENGRLRGLAAWRLLAWDSRHFGVPAARVDILRATGEYAEQRRMLSALLGEVLADCRSGGIGHLTARLDAGETAGLHALESAGFEMIDGIQTFSLRLAGAGPIAGGTPQVNVRSYQSGDLPEILAIARRAYRHDRFHADAALSPEIADAVNEAWVQNSCLGQAADHVVVAEWGTQVAGYVTCKLDRDTLDLTGELFGSIVMVATAETARGQGVGRAATAGALEWFRRQGTSVVEVGTQLRNIAAGRLYEACGFRLSAASLTLRKLL